MKAKGTIRKILIAIIWMILGGGMLSLLLAAQGKNLRKSCTGYQVEINGMGDNRFLQEEEIMTTAYGKEFRKMKGMELRKLDLQLMERRLSAHVWIRDAQLYIDAHGLLHISVTERAPVARIFMTNGASFYIDSGGHRMPLSTNFSYRLPVFTGYPVKQSPKKDSAMLKEVSRLADFIGRDAFWNAQVAQVDIVGNEFEIVPLVGEHIVRVGNTGNLQTKFDRLRIFYRQVMAKRGPAVYDTIDLRFTGQLVASRRESGERGGERVVESRIVGERERETEPERETETERERVGRMPRAVMPARNN